MTATVSERLSLLVADLTAERAEHLAQVELIDKAIAALTDLDLGETPTVVKPKRASKPKVSNGQGRPRRPGAPVRRDDDEVRRLFERVDQSKPLAGQLAMQGVPRGSMDLLVKRATELGLLVKKADRFGDAGPIRRTAVDEQAARNGAAAAMYSEPAG